MAFQVKKSMFRPLCFVLVGIIGLFTFVQQAAAELTIAPLTVEMQDRQRSAEVHLVNTSNRTNTYRIEWRYMRMMENGRYERLEQAWTDFDLPAAARVAPRQITLRPGEHQTVRLSLRRPPDLKPGDYRAHLLFQGLGSEEERQALLGNSRGTGVSAAAKANLGFAVPVLYRVGPIDVKATVEKIDMSRDKKGKRFLNITIKRDGTHGLMGDLQLERVNPKKDATRITRRTQVNVFPELNRRSFRYYIPDDVLSGEEMILRYTNVKLGETMLEHRFVVP